MGNKNQMFLERVHGFDVIKQNDTQYKVAHDSIGIFITLNPEVQHYHNIITDEKGRYKTAQRFLELQLGRSIKYLAKIPQPSSNELESVD